MRVSVRIWILTLNIVHCIHIKATISLLLNKERVWIWSPWRHWTLPLRSTIINKILILLWIRLRRLVWLAIQIHNWWNVYSGRVSFRWIHLLFFLFWLIMRCNLARIILWESGRVSTLELMVRYRFTLNLRKIKKEIFYSLASFFNFCLRVRYSFGPKAKELFNFFFCVMACFRKRHLLFFRRSHSFLRI